MKTLFASLALFALTVPKLVYGDGSQSINSTGEITTIGTCILHVPPDQIDLTFSLIEKNKTLAGSKKMYDQVRSALIDYLKHQGESVSEIQEGGLAISKTDFISDYRQTDIPNPTPYACSTDISFTLSDFSKYPDICDFICKQNGVDISPVSYTTSKEATLRVEALKRALLDAHDRAEALAMTAGCTVGAPLNITEVKGDSSLFTQMMAAGRNSTTLASSPSGGLAAGQIEVTATITATYSLTK